MKDFYSKYLLVLPILLVSFGALSGVSEERPKADKTFYSLKESFEYGSYSEVIGGINASLKKTVRLSGTQAEQARLGFLLARAYYADYQFDKASAVYSAAVQALSEAAADDTKQQALAVQVDYLIDAGVFSEAYNIVQNAGAKDFELQIRKVEVLTNLGYGNEALALINTLEPTLLNNTAQAALTKQEKVDAKRAYAHLLNLKAVVMLKRGEGPATSVLLKVNRLWIKDNLGNSSIENREAVWLEAQSFEQQEDYTKAARYYQKAYGTGSFANTERIQLKIMADLVNAYVISDQYTRYTSYNKRLQMHSHRSLNSKELEDNLYNYANCKRLNTQGYYSAALEKTNKLVKKTAYLPATDPLRLEMKRFQYDVLINNGNIAEGGKALDSLLADAEVSYGKNAPEYNRLRIEKADWIVKYGIDYPMALTIKRESYDAIVAPQITERQPDYLRYADLFSDLYVLTGKYEDARALSENSVKVALERFGENDSRYAYELARYAEITGLLGDYNTVNDKLNVISGILNKSIKKDEASRETALLVADLYSQLGEFDKSKEAAFRAFRASRKVLEPQELKVARLNDELAGVYMDLGNYSTADDYLAASLSIKDRKVGDGSKLAFTTLSGQGTLYLMQGDYNRAEKAIVKSLSVANLCYGVQSLQAGTALTSLSDFNMAIGDYSKAEENLNKVLAIYETRLGKGHFKRAQILNKIAVVKSKKGKAELKEIEKLFEESNSVITKSLSTNNPIYYDQLQSQAEVYYQMKQSDKALKHLPEIEKFWISKLGENNAHVASVRLLKGKVLYQKGNYDDAEVALKSSRSLYNSIYSDNHPGYVQASSNLAKIYYIKGKKAEALEILEETTEKNLVFTEKYFPQLSFSEKSKYWSQVKDEFEFFNFLCYTQKNVKPELAAKMYNNTITTKAILLSNSIKVKQRVLSSNDSTLIKLYDEYIENKEFMTSSLGLSKQQLSEQNIDIKLLETRVEVLEKELSARSEVFAESRSKAVSWKDVRDILTANEYAIEMLRFRHFDKDFTDSVIYAGLVVSEKTKDYPELVIIEKGNQLEKKNLKYYRNSVIFNNTDRLSYDAFWGALKAGIPDNATVYISSEGVYNQINLEMLSKDGVFALDKNNFVLVSNTKDLVKSKVVSSAKTSRKTTKTKVKEEIYIAGSPAFYLPNSAITSGSRTIVALPGAEKEVKSLSSIVASLGYQVVEKLGNNVQEDTIKQIENPKVFHIATHGYFKERSGDDIEEGLAANPLLNSGLLLSGAGDIINNTENKYVNSQSGILTAYEAMNLNFDKTELVVLSACETGLGEVQIGEGVYGLQRSFLIAGADAIIMSLFKVNDEITQKLMSSFYTNWLKSGNKRQAFIDAKKEIKKDYDDPKLWGAFVMVETTK